MPRTSSAIKRAAMSSAECRAHPGYVWRKATVIQKGKFAGNVRRGSCTKPSPRTQYKGKPIKRRSASSLARAGMTSAQCRAAGLVWRHGGTYKYKSGKKAGQEYHRKGSCSKPREQGLGLARLFKTPVQRKPRSASSKLRAKMTSAQCREAGHQWVPKGKYASGREYRAHCRKIRVSKY